MTWDDGQRTSQYDLQLKMKTEGDPEKPPPAKPGDGYVLLGLVTGMIVGAVGGGLVGSACHCRSGVFGAGRILDRRPGPEGCPRQAQACRRNEALAGGAVHG